MALDLRDCTFFGPALPEPFVKFQLEGELQKRKLLPKGTGEEGQRLQDSWEVYRRKLRNLGEQGGDRRVAGHVLDPLAERLGYQGFARQAEVMTREGPEDGGWLFTGADGRLMRAWSVGLGMDLDAPSRRGRAYRFSPSRVAQRVLLAKSERVGLLTDGEELRLLLCDSARPESHIAVRLDRAGGWRATQGVPDSYRLFLALASTEGVAALPELADAARLAQSTVTKKLRLQARRAIEWFLQELLDHPGNRAVCEEWTDAAEMSRRLWREGLILIYRLLFVFKLESSADPARAFSFSATSLWRNTYSPNTALAPMVRKVLDQGADTGGFLEGGLRVLWRMFADGMSTSELEIKALGGMLFGEGTTPLLDRLHWGEHAVARLLDALLWTPGDGKTERERVHYGALDVEDLGRVYEALLELEPGISSEPMCRLRRAKLEVVVPVAQGASYRNGSPAEDPDQDNEDDPESEEESDDGEIEKPDRAGKPAKGGKTRVQFVEEIPAGRFFLRVGLGRKASGSYYTPHPFVRFLVQETLGPQLSERSPKEDPNPLRILELKVLDPAMGSGHFLVEGCRYLGEALYEACRLCDELAVQAEEQAEKATEPAEHDRLLAHADELRKRVEDLPDIEDELVAYLPSRAAEGEESGLSQRKAEALCRRLIAVHCLYGVDKNPLAVELAKLSLWLESYAEGLPLTFLDHRLVCGDSLTGPFFEHLLSYPKSGEKLDDLFAQGLTARLRATFSAALVHVRDLEASVGKDVADLDQKRVAKDKLDAALQPLKTLAAAWSGGVMLGAGAKNWNGESGMGNGGVDGAYRALAVAVAGGWEAGKGESDEHVLAARPGLREMTRVGGEGVAFELVFPEVFWPAGLTAQAGESEMGTGEWGRRGFDAVLGNPPWEAIRRADDQFFGGIDLRALIGATKREKKTVHQYLLADPIVASRYAEYVGTFESQDRASDRLFSVHKVQVKGNLAGRGMYDAYMLFAEASAKHLRPGGLVGLVLPSAFHANEGATGVRQLYLEKMALKCCFSFENRRKLFDIDSRFKFAAIVAQKDPAGTDEFACGFYWHDLERLFEAEGRLRYSAEFVRRTGGEYLTLLELRSHVDRNAAASMYGSGLAFGDAASRSGLKLSQEINMTYEAHRFTPVASVLPPNADARVPEVAADLRFRGYLPLHEGKTFHQYDDRWEARPRYLVALKALADKPGWLRAAQHYRLAFRDIASSTNERTGIFCLLPPGVVCGNTAPCEREPHTRSAVHAILLQAVANSYPFDWSIRIKAAAHVNLFILNGCPFPNLDVASSSRSASPIPDSRFPIPPSPSSIPDSPFPIPSSPSSLPPSPRERFLTHSALRLTCNHAGYAPLWAEQLGDGWRESRAKHAWPVLQGDDERWAVRAAIDAMVADAYGLNREQYAHVLSTFSHRSYPRAPDLCLAAFDELKDMGIEAFARKHDPYRDIPLNERLPKPVIVLPIPGETKTDSRSGAEIVGKSGQVSLIADIGPLFEGTGGNDDRLPQARRGQEQSSTIDDPHDRRHIVHELRNPSGTSDESIGQPSPVPRLGNSTNTTSEENYRAIAALLEARGVITSADAQQVTGLDAAGIRPHLKRLVIEGLAVTEGQRRGMKYRKASHA